MDQAMPKKQLYTIAGVVAIVLVAGIYLAGSKESKTNVSSQPSEPTSPSAPSPDVVAPSAPTPAPAPVPAPKPTTPPAKTTPPVTTSYAAAVKTYAGRRMQFDDRCQADPTKFVFKNPGTMMLDNRSQFGRTITVGGVAHYLAGYGFQIITVSSSHLPTTLDVDCGAAQNVAKVELQK